MDNLLSGLKGLAVVALMVRIFVGGPIWGATGSLARAWDAVKEYSQVMGWLVLIGGGFGIIAALIT